MDEKDSFLGPTFPTFRDRRCRCCRLRDVKGNGGRTDCEKCLNVENRSILQLASDSIDEKYK